MPIHTQTKFSLIKKLKIGRPEHSLTPTPLRPITSHFCLNPPPPLKVDVICVSPLNYLLLYASIRICSQMP